MRDDDAQLPSLEALRFVEQTTQDVCVWHLASDSNRGVCSAVVPFTQVRVCVSVCKCTPKILSWTAFSVYAL